MKFSLFLLLIFVFSFSTFSQEERKKWSAEAKLTPSLSFSKYRTSNPAPTLQYMADLLEKNTARRPQTTLGVSFQTSYWIRKSHRVNLGVSYSGYGEQYYFASTDQGPTVLEVFTRREKITNHYLGIPISFSSHFRNREKSSLYATLGCNFEFLLFNSEVVNTRLVNHANDTGNRSRTVFFLSRDELLSDVGLNGFNSSLSASFGVCLNAGKRSQFRIGPYAQLMLTPYREFPVQHYFYNVGLEIAHVFARW